MVDVSAAHQNDADGHLPFVPDSPAVC